MGRAPCCEKEGLKKGPWTPEEDKILVDYIQSNGHGSWRSLPKLAGLLRCGKSCRLRWTNYLRPDIKRGPFTADEQKTIIQLHGIVGNKWSTIAAQLPGRTDNEVKNYWNTHLKKRLMKMGIDPDTYTPATTAVTVSGDPSSSSLLSSSSSSPYARHMAQWESARLEAEARLAKESLLHSPPGTSAGEEATVSDKMETDFFLKIWNSEVGRAFRAKESRPVAQPVSEVQGSSSSASSPATSSNTKLKEETSEEGATTTTTNTTTTNTTTTSEEESYQMYLDFAAVGMDYDSLGFSSLFSNIQFGGFSLFDGGDHRINNESSLDGIDGFINKWDDGDHHNHHLHHHLMDKTQKTSASTRV